VFAPKKPDPPDGQKSLRLAQTKPSVSTQSGNDPCAILFPYHFRLAPKLLENSCSTIQPSSALKNEQTPLSRLSCDLSRKGQARKIYICRFFPICTLSISSRVNRIPRAIKYPVVAGLVCPAIRCAISMRPCDHVRHHSVADLKKETCSNATSFNCKLSDKLIPNPGSDLVLKTVDPPSLGSALCGKRYQKVE
jgi:hypothetical protein